jgi:hypothetical protein
MLIAFNYEILIVDKNLKRLWGEFVSYVKGLIA